VYQKKTLQLIILKAIIPTKKVLKQTIFMS